MLICRNSPKMKTCPTRRIRTTGRGCQAKKASESSSSARFSRKNSVRHPREFKLRKARGNTCESGMSVHRVMGIETEFGVFAPDDPEADPGALSHLVVEAFAAASAADGRPLKTAWDYSGEDPLRDARGYDVPKKLARPEQLTHEISHAVPNLVLRNGGRLYVDHAHPEYSSPEFTTPTAGVRWDRAGEIVARRAVAELAGREWGPHPLLYKNNADGKGASYGTHENYLVDRQVPFEDLVAGLIPFLDTRQNIFGARLGGIGAAREAPGVAVAEGGGH